MRKSIVFYASWFEAIETLPKAIQGEAYRAVLTYGFKNVEIEEHGQMTKLIMTMVKPMMDVNTQRFENGCKGGEYGRLGGRPKQGEKPQRNPKETPKKPQRNPKETPKKPQRNPKETPNDNVNDNDKLKKTLSNESVKKSATNVATLAERKQSFALSLEPYLAKYSREMLNDFYAYWTEENQSRTKMRFELEKTWGLGNRLATWAKRENNFKQSSNGTTTFKSYQQAERDFRAEQNQQFADHIRQKLAGAIS